MGIINEGVPTEGVALNRISTVRTVCTALLSKMPTRRVAMHMTLVGVVTQCADTAIFRGPSP